MKFKNLILGLGMIFLMFSSCSDELNELKSPIDNSTFGIDTKFDVLTDYGTFIDIEEYQTSFMLPVTRTTPSTDSVTVIVKCEVESDIFSCNLPDGTDVAFQPKEGKYVAEMPLTFAPNETSASIRISFPWEKFASLLYTCPFEISIFEDISGYMILHKPVIFQCMRWKTVTGPNGETTATWKDRAIFTGITFNNGDPIDLFTWDVTIQSTDVFPGLYRVINPYEGVYQANEENGSLTYNGTGTIYMYINAMDPDNVYLSDKMGNPLPEFNTYYTLMGEYGDLQLFDRIAGGLADQYLYDNKDLFSNEGAGLGTRVDFEKGGQTYVDYISFDEGHFYVVGDFDGYELPSDELQIIFPGGQGKREWNDLGMATYTEDMLSAYYGMGVQTYQVPVQQNIDNPSVYRMINPYTNYWPESNPQDDDYNITIDCSDPDFVLVVPQNTGNWLESDEIYEAWMTNVAYYYTVLVTDRYKKTQAELTSAGMNDTFKDGVIDIKNAMALAIDEEGKIVREESFNCSAFGATGCKLVLPTEKAATESYATSAASNKGKKTSTNPMKLVKLFGLNPMK